MSALRRRIGRPGTWLGLLAILVLLAALDSLRAPEHQITARLYIGAVDVYQDVSGATVGGFIQCRYTPSCSHFSQDAVRAHGIRYGLCLTVNRVCRCTPGVSVCTPDPVPVAAAE